MTVLTRAPHRAGPSRLRRLPDVLLTIAAGAGLLSLCALAVSALLGLSLITFATGSMSPTMPAGSLAVVRGVPASELRPGQVVTLTREGNRIPVTHRIVSIGPAPLGGEAGARSIVMRGDANPAADATPYIVSSGRLVLWAVPGAAGIAAAAGHPLTVGAIAALCSALVLWAFWPRRRVDLEPCPSIS